MQAAFQKHCDNAISKCVIEGTLVSTSGGLIPIEKLGVSTHTPVSSFSKAVDLKITGSDGNSYPIKQFYNNGESKTVVITMDDGSVIEGTPNHRVMTEKMEWKALKDLQIDDFVQCRFVKSHGSGGMKIECMKSDDGYGAAEGENSNNANSHMTDRLAQLIGMMCACGDSNGIDQVSLSKNDIVVIEKFVRLCQGFSCRKYNINREASKCKACCIVTSESLAVLVTKMTGIGSGKKRIPEEIMQGSEIEKLAFLSGLSVGARVNGSDELLICNNETRQFAYQCDALCRSLGAPIVRTTKNKASLYGPGRVYSVSLKGKVLKMVDCIQQNKKLNPLSECKWLVRVPSGIERMNIPNDHCGYVDYLELKHANPTVYWNTGLNRVGLRYDPLEYLVQVKSISNGIGYKRTFDIEVESPDNSYVVASGFVTHNTINFPESATIDDIHRGYFTAWRSGCKGVTIFRDKCRDFQILNVGVSQEEEKEKEKKSDNETTNNTNTKVTPIVNESQNTELAHNLEILCLLWAHENEKRRTKPQSRSFDDLAETLNTNNNLHEKGENDDTINIADNDEPCKKLLSQMIAVAEKIRLQNHVETPKPILGKTHCPSCITVKLMSVSGCKQCTVCSFSACDYKV